MPSVLRVGQYRFFFFSDEGTEPPHIHVQNGKQLAKFWLTPISLARSTDFPAHELTRLERLVATHQQDFLKAWNDFFGN